MWAERLKPQSCTVCNEIDPDIPGFAEWACTSNGRRVEDKQSYLCQPCLTADKRWGAAKCDGDNTCCRRIAGLGSNLALLSMTHWWICQSVFTVSVTRSLLVDVLSKSFFTEPFSQSANCWFNRSALWMKIIYTDRTIPAVVDWAALVLSAS